MKRIDLNFAFKVGLSAFLSLLFTLALFASPFLASHQNFAHTHPEETPQHTHSLVAILVALVTNLGTTSTFSFLVVLLICSYTSVVLQKIFHYRARSRAPPLSSVML